MEKLDEESIKNLMERFEVWQPNEVPYINLSPDFGAVDLANPQVGYVSVPFSDIPVGEWFLWRGKIWNKASPGLATRHGDMSFRHETLFPSVPVKPYKWPAT